MKFEQLCDLIKDTLKLNNTVLNSDTKLLGHLPEFDSLSLLILLTKLEKNYNINIEEEKLTGEIFTTIGHLWEYIKNKNVGTYT